jgi:hypothetical protein
MVIDFKSTMDFIQAGWICHSVIQVATSGHSTCTTPNGVHRLDSPQHYTPTSTLVNIQFSPMPGLKRFFWAATEAVNQNCCMCLHGFSSMPSLKHLGTTKYNTPA